MRGERKEYVFGGSPEIADQVASVVSRILEIDIKPFAGDAEVAPNTRLALLVGQLEIYRERHLSVLSANLALNARFGLKDLLGNTEIADLSRLEHIPNRGKVFKQWGNFAEKLSKQEKDSLSRLLNDFQKKYRYAGTLGDIRKDIKGGTLGNINGIGKLRVLFAQVAFFPYDVNET